MDNKNTINCSVSGECGGCCYMGMVYEDTLEIKKKRVNELFAGLCHVDKVNGMYHPVHYRNKIHAVVGTGRGGAVITGCYREGTHDVVPVNDCMIHDSECDRIIQVIRELMKMFKYKPYDEDAGKGFLRHILIRKGFSTGEIMVVLVTPDMTFPSKKAFVAELLSRCPSITTIVQNVNGARTSIVLGKRNVVLYGNGYIEDVLCRNRFRISTDSFYQINPAQTEKLYKAAIRAAGIDKSMLVLDAYCGIGTIGITAASSCREVIGVELNANAVADAKINAGLNKVKNIRFVCQDAGRFMVENADRLKVDVVFMDPPRSGSDDAFLSSVLKLNPKKIVYISCEPATQVRDVRVLMDGGYSITGMETFDMFPCTDNIENIVALSK